jgi:hypothetical protein
MKFIFLSLIGAALADPTRFLVQNNAAVVSPHDPSSFVQVSPSELERLEAKTAASKKKLFEAMQALKNDQNAFRQEQQHFSEEAKEYARKADADLHHK